MSYLRKNKVKITLLSWEDRGECVAAVVSCRFQIPIKLATLSVHCVAVLISACQQEHH